MNTITKPELGATLRKLTMLLVLATACVLFSGVSAYAEGEGEAEGSVEEKIKKKMQEIIKLMEENERVLLKVSTGASGKARRVDVDVPDPKGKGGTSSKGGNSSEGGSGQGSSGGGSAGGSSGGSSGGGEKAKEIGRKMRELIEGQKSKGGKIPGEMGELMRMIPRKSGKGQQGGQPQDGGDPKSKEQKEQEARDARKELGEKNEQNDPKDGDKPKDPAKRVPKGGKPDASKVDQAQRKDNVPPWAATLPPEIRDALAGGRAEDVPAKYRPLIKKYHLWLQKNRKR